MFEILTENSYLNHKLWLVWTISLKDPDGEHARRVLQRMAGGQQGGRGQDMGYGGMSIPPSIANNPNLPPEVIHALQAGRLGNTVFVANVRAWYCWYSPDWSWSQGHFLRLLSCPTLGWAWLTLYVWSKVLVLSLSCYSLVTMLCMVSVFLLCIFAESSFSTVLFSWISKWAGRNWRRCLEWLVWWSEPTSRKIKMERVAAWERFLSSSLWRLFRPSVSFAISNQFKANGESTWPLKLCKT